MEEEVRMDADDPTRDTVEGDKEDGAPPASTGEGVASTGEVLGTTGLAPSSREDEEEPQMDMVDTFSNVSSSSCWGDEETEE